MNTVNCELTYTQQSQVLSRFTVEPVYGAWDPTKQAYTGRKAVVHCKMCPQLDERIEGLKTHKSSWQIEEEGVVRVYRSHSTSNVQPTMRALYAHLVQVHNVSPCKVCNQLVTHRGVKKHQASPACQSELRRFSMREMGFERLHTHLQSVFLSAMNDKAKELKAHVDWMDWKMFRKIDRSLEEAKEEFLDRLGITNARTAWNPTCRTYEEECWAPEGISVLLDLLYGSPGEEALHTLNEFLDGTQETKDSILAILELRKENS
ncbi:MAG: hypothetical protein EBS53_05055 [Bacteroidetes bacterium]|nr:hypothetical protein [Bacteroidota bacterium]